MAALFIDTARKMRFVVFVLLPVSAVFCLLNILQPAGLYNTLWARPYGWFDGLTRIVLYGLLTAVIVFGLHGEKLCRWLTAAALSARLCWFIFELTRTNFETMSTVSILMRTLLALALLGALLMVALDRRLDRKRGIVQLLGMCGMVGGLLLAYLSVSGLLDALELAREGRIGLTVDYVCSAAEALFFIQLSVFIGRAARGESAEETTER